MENEKPATSERNSISLPKTVFYAVLISLATAAFSVWQETKRMAYQWEEMQQWKISVEKRLDASEKSVIDLRVEIIGGFSRLELKMEQTMHQNQKR